jgi:hypothetical protein
VRAGCRWCDRQTVHGAFARGGDHALPLRAGASPGARPVGFLERVRSTVRGA